MEFTTNSVRIKSPNEKSGARPGPFMGSEGSVKASSRIAVILGRTAETSTS